MNKLVAYFSPTGTTAAAAKTLAEAAGAPLYEIRPAEPYTSADLNYMDKQSRSSIEMSDTSSRPALADTDAPVAEADVVFVGFPIWWYVAPTIINSFLEAYDFSGKTIILFATSGGSGFGKAVDGLKTSVARDTVIREGQVFRGKPSVAGMKTWVDSLGL
ncbi:MAG: NAD(P)H-dependent oxidoreductase [Clostridiales bacterium]|nr:NAD(P)H-dependent oxidoreductase [Clostridiales bacterium]